MSDSDLVIWALSPCQPKLVLACLLRSQSAMMISKYGLMSFLDHVEERWKQLGG